MTLSEEETKKIREFGLFVAMKSLQHFGVRTKPDWRHIDEDLIRKVQLSQRALSVAMIDLLHLACRGDRSAALYEAEIFHEAVVLSLKEDKGYA